MNRVVLSLALWLIPALLPGQNRVDSRNLHERLIAVVPLIGAGTYSDPRRPLFAPASAEETQRMGLISFHWEPSDDGKLAIAEFVFTTGSSRNLVSNAKVLKSFLKGQSRKEDIERELKAFRKSFRLESFGAPDGGLR